MTAANWIPELTLAGGQPLYSVMVSLPSVVVGNTGSDRSRCNHLHALWLDLNCTLPRGSAINQRPEWQSLHTTDWKGLYH